MNWTNEFSQREQENIQRESLELMIAARKRCNKDYQLEMIQQSLDYACKVHSGMRRHSGEPYVLHPIAVAKIVVSEIGLGWKSICAALLHDVYESGQCTHEDIEKAFGDKVASLVDGLQKIKTVLAEKGCENSEQIQAENFKRMLLCLNDDARVVLIKLADRLHNTRCVEYFPEAKRNRIMDENMYLFIPMAHRLGLYGIKSEMENIWLRFKEPQAYNDIVSLINLDSSNKDKMIGDFLKPIREALDNAGISYTITQRVKTPYSIWHKMTQKQMEFSQIADLYAVRIVFNSPSDDDIVAERNECFQIFNIVSNLYEYRKDRTRDWVMNPKPNGYEALHITAVTAEGRNVEVQIRSKRMNELAEKGIAAHWNYKKNKPDAQEGQLDLWLGEIKEILKEKDIDKLEKLEQVHKKFVLCASACLVMLGTMLFSHSCANTTQAPSGGAKDTIPPTLIAVTPGPSQIEVPTKKPVFYFNFNEYVVVKDAKSLVISPPLSKPLKTSIVKKSLKVTSEEDLLPNTTYTIDITGVIGDNNEGNMFPGYVLTFSTGKQIDSMYMTGTVMDCATLNYVKGATVLLYKDHADSAIFKHLPDAAVKTDDWGYFCVRNIQDTLYRLYAITDENSNFMFDEETEKVAFCDTLVKPRHKIAKDVYELYKFDMKDTASCMKRISDYELKLFKGSNSKQMIKAKARTGDRSAYVSFLAPFVQIKSLWFKGVPKQNIIRQFNANQDSLLLWVNDQRKQPDTLHLNIEYMKTDTTGKLVKTLEKLKLPRDKKEIMARKSSRRDIKHEDTIAVYKVESAGENFEQYGIRVVFNNPLIQEDFDHLKYEVFNARQQKLKAKYTWSRDSTDVRAYIIKHVGKIQPAYEYQLTIPHRKFQDIDGYYNDSLLVKVKLPEDDKLSNITLNLTGVNSKYIVDLMDEKRSNVLRSFTVFKNTSLVYPYLKEGKYCIRIVHDPNGNGRVDTGNLLEHKQPEKVLFYKLKDGNILLPLMPSTDLVQDIDIGKMFK